ncbi:MAG: cache domain-containing protein [Bacteroidales bacterium]|nr:cache domain-containing protein [Bacteroidales bacterium]
MKNRKAGLRNFLFTIVFPTILAIGLFIVVMFFVFIPAFEKNMINAKREMIKELTNSTWGIFEKHENDVIIGLISREEAQKRAISEIEEIRYGDEGKDYFWITDSRPFMIMHPYRPELNGSDLSRIADPSGKLLFVEMVEAVKSNGYGYVDYMWQWKDDSTRIVPKLSYVKEFKPWGWVIGTGIYIEDVYDEIHRIEGRFSKLSIGIIVIIGLLLSFILYQSLRLETRRAKAEESLRESREKYRTLVEAATEGILMVLDNHIVYTNLPLQNLLGYSAGELMDLQPGELFDNKAGLDMTNLVTLASEKSSEVIETNVKTKSGRERLVSLTISAVEFGVKKGFTIIINDAQKNILIEEELNKNKEQIYSLTDTLNIGIFRTTFGKRGKFLDANPAALEIFGFTSLAELIEKSIYDLFFDENEKREFMHDIARDKSIKGRILRLSLNDGSFAIVSVSVVVTKDENGQDAFYEGIIQDITARKKAEDEKESLIADLQTSQFFINQPVKYFSIAPISCSINTSIKKVAELMTRNNFNAVLITAESGQHIGIITEGDLRRRVIIKELDYHKPASEIMSAPLISIDEKALFIEAVLSMSKHNVKYLVIRNSSNEIESIVSADILRKIQFQSHAILLRNINFAGSVDDIKSAHNQLPQLIKALIDNGMSSKNVNRVMTMVSDAITKKLIEFALQEMGDPPVPFAFVALGSEGREEQTLKTDQDNAIIFEDVSAENIDHVTKYFLKLGDTICTWLNQTGYVYCPGNIMAKNPKWCQSLTIWKNYFTTWISESTPQALLELNIFFDFRAIYGDLNLCKELNNHIDELIAIHPPFLLHMTENTLLYKPPLGILGNILVKDTDEKKHAMDIKESMVPLVSLARTYALKYKIHESNTIQRLELLYKQKVFQPSTFKDMIDAYKFLMQLRLKHQANQMDAGKNPDNLILPNILTTVEVSLLKKVLSGITKLQSMLSYDFKGRGN